MGQDAYELLWGERERPARGRPAALSRGRIVAEAIAIADTEGLDKVAMKRIAERLDSGVMSLYRHVPGKSELVALMYDEIMDVPLKLPSDQGWRTAMSAWGRAIRELFVGHPWALPLATANHVMGPNEARWLDSALGALAESELPIDIRMAVVLTIDFYVLGAVPTELEPEVGAETLWFRLVGDPAARERFPHIARVVDERVVEDSPVIDDQFEFGLERVLDGLERFIDA